MANAATGKPELLFRFHCRMDRDALRARAARGADRHEFSALHFVSAEAEALAAWRDEHAARLAPPSGALLTLLLDEE
jgi:hypothetical protein